MHEPPGVISRMPSLDPRFPKALSPTDATLDAPSESSGSLPESVQTGCVGPECRVHLVQGSGTDLSGETEKLLRSRLRSAALLLFAGFAAFLVWHTIRIEFDSRCGSSCMPPIWSAR